MSWMKFVINDLKIDYIGGDIVPELVNKNNQNFEKLKFIEFDIINSTDYPKVELIHIKDCLFHFSFKDIVRVINSLKKSNIKKMLLTSHKSKILKNLDIQTGDFRYLDLEKKPFNFPKPKKRVKDFKFGEFPKYVNLWNIDEIPNFPNEE